LVVGHHFHYTLEGPISLRNVWGSGAVNHCNQQLDNGRLLALLKLELDGNQLELPNITPDTLMVWGN
jgi:hypothetical protein